MIFYLGTHRPGWLARMNDIPMCVSRRTLAERKRLPVAHVPWLLDSGGFTELALRGCWTICEAEYAEQVERIILGVGNCRHVAPQDWMCEPSMLAKTGLTVREHQERTVNNFVELRQRLGKIVFPVLQGWETGDYHFCLELYRDAGVDIEAEPLIGLGSVCRRGSDKQISEIVRSLDGWPLHAFGVRGTALKALAPHLKSADSMAWSYAGRHKARLPICVHKGKTEANCMTWARIWYRDRIWDINQARIPCAA